MDILTFLVKNESRNFKGIITINRVYNCCVVFLFISVNQILMIIFCRTYSSDAH